MFIRLSFKPKNNLAKSIIYMIGGAVIITVGLTFINSDTPPEGWQTTNGTVVDYRKYEKLEGAANYPLYVAYDVKEQSFVTKSDRFSSFEPTIGSSELVAYNPSDPADALILTEEAERSSIIYYIFGGTLVLYGLHLLIVSRKD